MAQLKPTVADGPAQWRQHLNQAAMVVSTLLPAETIAAAKELARDLAQDDRAVVVTGVGASEPLFWQVPAGKDLHSVRPDLVMMLARKQFSASTRLLLDTAPLVMLFTDGSSQHRLPALKLMQLIVQTASPSHIEVVVVADRQEGARETGTELVALANDRFANRTNWRHLPAQRIRPAAQDKEGAHMASTKSRPVPLSEAEIIAQEWDRSFRRAERLLQEAQDTLQRQLAKPAGPAPEAPPRTL